jgi:hypothetical protein
MVAEELDGQTASMSAVGDIHVLLDQYRRSWPVKLRSNPYVLPNQSKTSFIQFGYRTSAGLRLHDGTWIVDAKSLNLSLPNAFHLAGFLIPFGFSRNERY